MNSSSVSNSPHLHCGFASASPEQSPCIIICMLWLSAAHLVPQSFDLLPRVFLAVFNGCWRSLACLLCCPVRSSCVCFATAAAAATIARPPHDPFLTQHTLHAAYGPFA